MNPNDRPTLGADGSLTGDRLETGTGIRDGLADGDYRVASDGVVEYGTGTTTVGLVAADGVALATVTDAGVETERRDGTGALMNGAAGSIR